MPTITHKALEGVIRARKTHRAINGDAVVTVDTFSNMDLEVVEGKVVFKGRVVVPSVVEISESADNTTGEAN